jgi:glutamyl/glutaminyl-tRNA synthetase
LIARFTLEGISGGNAVFNTEKLDWFNQQHIARLSTSDFADRVIPLLHDAHLWDETLDAGRRDWFLRLCELLKPRMKRLDGFADAARPFLEDRPSVESAAAAKHLAKPELRSPLAALAVAYDSLEPFAAAELESVLRATADAHGVKAAALIHATRVAITGRAVSPGVFEVLELLGRDSAVARLRDALDLIPA